MGSSRLILSRIAAAYLSRCWRCCWSLSSAPSAPAQDLDGAAAARSGDPHRHAAERPHLFHPPATRGPTNRVMLRLAVKAGSIDEADDQRGLAHVLEHMAFNGTTHFKPGELVKYLESIGARFGPHVNAYTSFDETVYMLDVPTDRAGALRRGFEALSDFAGGITLDAARDRQGARRRHRGVARPAGRRHAHAAAADQGALRRRRATPTACRSARPRS